jgi:GAF domain-containing protein
MVKRAPRDLSPDAQAILREIALRGETAVRLDSDPEMVLLRTIVDATVGIFAAEAASIALLDEASGNLRFVVAAGAQGQPVVGMTIGPSQGIAGYVFSTGESIAIVDPAHDPRFGRNVADQTGYVPRSLLAVPLVDAGRPMGVLEVIDKREGPFTIHDIETGALFARQAATAIMVAGRARELRSILTDVLRSERDGRDEDRGATTAAVTELVSAATRRRAGDDRFWAFVDAIATMRQSSAADRDLAIQLLSVIASHRSAGGLDASGRLGRLRR